MRHLDVEQARALRAKYPEWPRWTALEKGDWVDHPVFNRPALVDRRTPKGRIVLTTSSGHYPPADCLLRGRPGKRDKCRVGLQPVTQAAREPSE